jgi:lycopene cyclase domain-containing protein
MHYLQFLLYFMVAPAALLLAVHGVAGIRATLAAGGVLAAAGLVMLVPWARLVVGTGTWDHTAETVVAEAWGLPLEDLAFFALQAVFVTTLTAILLRGRWWRS